MAIPLITLQAQQKLSQDEAVSIALKNNYDILVARNASDMAKINNTAGNAGMLPNVAVTSSENYSMSNVYQLYTNVPEIKSPDGHANSLQRKRCTYLDPF